MPIGTGRRIENLGAVNMHRTVPEPPQTLPSVSSCPALYRMASLFVVPSLYEGFGMSAIEAMACGYPTVLSNTGSLPETAGGAAGFLNPLGVLEIAGGSNRFSRTIGRGQT